MWKCTNDENCNSIFPHKDLGWKLWESWELLPATPKVIEATKDSSGNTEPSMAELLDKINSIPFEKGYELAMKTIVLPMSLDEFKECFMDEGAPYFATKLL